MKVALVVGHHENSKGAYSPHLKTSEWDFYNDVVDCVPDVDVYFHDTNIRSYTQRIKHTARKLNSKGYDLVMELHFNSSSNPSANGCETLYYFASRKGKEYAKLFSDTVTLWTGIKSRNGGLKALTQSKDRGYASVFYPEAPTILIEPFFGSSKKDCELIENPELVASIINDFLNKIA